MEIAVPKKEEQNRESVRRRGNKQNTAFWKMKDTFGMQYFDRGQKR